MARESLPFIVPLLLATVLCAFWFARAGNGTAFAFLCTLALLTAFTAFFFRDPERDVPTAEGILVSPADGRVCQIIETEDPYLGGRVRQVSIFLNVFNVHVNRVPAAGRVEVVKHHPGKFLAAWDHKASLNNEQTRVGIDCGAYKILVRQIAGFIARRVVCRLSEGQAVRRGDRFGMIKFGSRTDLLLPLNAAVKVRVGDAVKGGSSVIAVMP